MDGRVSWRTGWSRSLVKARKVWAMTPFVQRSVERMKGLKRLSRQSWRSRKQGACMTEMTRKNKLPNTQTEPQVVKKGAALIFVSNWALPHLVCLYKGLASTMAILGESEKCSQNIVFTAFSLPHDNEKQPHCSHWDEALWLTKVRSYKHKQLYMTMKVYNLKEIDLQIKENA